MYNNNTSATMMDSNFQISDACHPGFHILLLNKSYQYDDDTHNHTHAHASRIQLYIYIIKSLYIMFYYIYDTIYNER